MTVMMPGSEKHSGVTNHENTRGEQVQAEQRLTVLLKEYELCINRCDKVVDRNFVLLGVIATLLAAAIAYLAQKGTVDNLILLLGPAVFSVFFVLVVNNFYLLSSLSGISRVIGLRINSMIDEKALLQFDPDLSRALLSIRKGNPKYRTLLFFVICTVLFLYMVLLALSFLRIYQQNHMYAVTFISFYSTIALLISWIASGVFRDIPNFYSRVVEKMHTDGIISTSALTSFSLKRPLTTFIFAIAPRPLDLVWKGQFFWYGFLAASVIAPPSEQFLRVANVLFRGERDWTSVADVPFLIILGVGCVFFIVQEVFLQQGKLLWDDIRDVAKVTDHVYKGSRAFTSGYLSIGVAELQVLLRWSAALILAPIIEGFALTILYLVISFHQILYVLWAKPRGRQYPKLLLLLAAPNMSLRFLGGVLSFGGVSVDLVPTTVLVFILYLIGIGSRSKHWQAEAQHNNNARSQSKYYLSNGRFFYFVGLVSALILTITSIYLYLADILSVSIYISSNIASRICSTSFNCLRIIQSNLLYNMIFTITTMLLSVILSCILFDQINIPDKMTELVINLRKKIYLNILMIVLFWMFTIIAVRFNSLKILLFTPIILIFVFFSTLHGASYEELVRFSPKIEQYWHRFKMYIFNQ